jgi:hypothetical protein
VLSDTSIRTIVLSHGQFIRHAEQTQVVALRQRHDLASRKELVVPHDQPRRQAGWPKELNAAVEVPWQPSRCTQRMGCRGPIGIAGNAARRMETRRAAEELCRLGSALEADQVLLSVDDLLRRKPQPHRFWELRTARIVTAAGSR